RRAFADETVERLENLWNAFRAQSQATIVQSTFVLPSERAFGNYELKVAESVGSIFAEINYRLLGLGRGDWRRWSRGHCARRVRRGRGVRRVPNVHSRTETARNHAGGGQQERA